MIVFLHGFNSGGNGQKARWLRQALAPVPVFTPTYTPHRADAALAQLRKFIRRLRRENPQDRKLLLIGSSLGGFWAHYLAPEFRAGIVLINPSREPDVSLRRALGVTQNEVTGGETRLGEEDLAALARYRRVPGQPSLPTLVLLDEADELLDARATADAFKGCGQTLLFPGGHHRFAHLPESLPAIQALYNSLGPSP